MVLPEIEHVNHVALSDTPHPVRLPEWGKRTKVGGVSVVGDTLIDPLFQPLWFIIGVSLRIRMECVWEIIR
jgi:hypothetical protein